MIRRNRIHTTLLLLASLLPAPHALTADHVVHPGQSIQAAIDAAQDNDRVIVKPGVFNEALEVIQKSIEIVGEGGAALTVINATGLRRSGIYVANYGSGYGYSWPDTVSIQGFTIRGGEGSGESPDFELGGGIFLDYYAMAVITDCVLENNQALYGGGICAFVDHLSDQNGEPEFLPRLVRCTIRNNSAVAGGGAYGKLWVQDCEFIGNSAQTDGGGTAHAIRVDRSRFVGNSAGGRGAGSYGLTPAPGEDVFLAYPTRIHDCVYENNVAGVSAGGAEIDLRAAAPFGIEVLRSRFIANSAPIAMDLRVALATDGDPTLLKARVDSCLFVNAGSTSSILAAGSEGERRLRGSTFYGARLDGHFSAVNCVLAGTPTPLASSANGSFEHCIAPLALSGPGNLIGDPLLADPAGGDFHLTSASPCIDVGDPATEGYFDGAFDIEGTPRVLGNAVDIGAYETAPDCNGDGVADWIGIFDGRIVDCDLNLVPDSCEPVLDCDGNGVHDPCDVGLGLVDDCNGNFVPDSCETDVLSDADHDGVLDACQYLRVPQDFATIQDAIDGATEPYKPITVDDGIYGGPGNTKLDFKGKGLILRSLRGAQHTILDGDGSAHAVSFKSKFEGTTRIEGFTIRGGSGVGGAIRIPVPSKLEIVRCILEDNVSTSGGGAIHATLGANVHLERCVIRLNRAAVGGGAIFASGPSTEIEIDHCTFAWNVALGTPGVQGVKAGGALLVANSARMIVRDSIFAGNSAPLGGVAHATDALTRCEIDRSLLDLGPSAVTTANGALAALDPENLAGDPGFIDAFGGDVHLAPNSQCLDRGTMTELDFEGDPIMGVADLGADEFHLHLYASGGLTPGAALTLVVVGPAAQGPVLLLASANRFVPPLATVFGPLEVAPPYFGGGPIVIATSLHGGSIQLAIPIHAALPPGIEIHVQALVAGASSPLTHAIRLAN
jgi:hypothetical protein